MTRWNEEYLDWLQSAVNALKRGRELCQEEKEALIQCAGEVLSDNA